MRHDPVQAADGLRVDGVAGEIGSDEPTPRFSWRLPGAEDEMAGYQIAVETETSHGRRSVWDSGAVDGALTYGVPYAGVPLEPFTRYQWRVRWRDVRGDSSPWSGWEAWETGPLTEADWSHATWIGGPIEYRAIEGDPDPRARPEPLLRRRFSVASPVRSARLYFCGLGYGIPWLNGRRASPAVLDPAPTRYDRTVLFTTHDVTDLLRSGGNVLGLELGRGRLGEPRPNVWHWDDADWWDHPKGLALLRVELIDGSVRTIVTDESWESSTGAVLRDSLFGGEWYDDRADRGDWSSPHASVGDADWAPARAAAPPGGVLRAQRQPAIMVTDSIAPVSVASPAPGTSVFDFGRQLAGWVRVEGLAPTGHRLTISYGEKLGPTGLVDGEQKFITPPFQRDVVVGAGRWLSHEPRFSYKGFRYVQVDGADEVEGLSISAQVAHSAVTERGTVRFSDELLNRIHRACKLSILDNLHGLPTDTPAYEKNGWTGDAHLSLESSLLNFDMSRLYVKWLRDFADAQTENGELPPIVPAARWGYRDSENPIAPVPSWDVAYAEICWGMYWYLGDDRPMRDHYENLVRYLRYLVGIYPDLHVTWGLGDWKPPLVDGHMPEGAGVYETIYLKRWSTLLARIARAIGRDDDAIGFDRLGVDVDAAFLEHYADASGDSFHGDVPSRYRQSIDVLALAHDLVPLKQRKAVVERLVSDIQARAHHLDTGVFGTKYLFDVLAANGHAELAFAVLVADGFPSYRNWFADGESTLWETWGPNSRSHNHHFFSSVDRWLYEGVLGVRPTSPGYRTFAVNASLLVKLDWAQGSLICPSGEIHVRWGSSADGERYLDVSVPPGTAATISCPGGTIVRGPGDHRLKPEREE